MPSYLTAGKIKEGMSGTISGEPREEKHDFQDGKGEKLLFRLPIKLDYPIMDEYTEEPAEEWIWNPGVFARSLLEKELGEEYQSWINTHGSFKIKQWSSKTRNGFAWHFIPDPIQQQKDRLPPVMVNPRIELDQGRTTLIECAYCSEAGDLWSTSKTEDMKAHVEKFHPDKLPKDGTKVPKVRVKKE